MMNSVYSIYRWSIKTDKMLPYVIVLLVATSALALPFDYVNVIPYPIGSGPQIADNGRLINNFVTSRALEYIDTGDLSLYGNMLLESIHSMAAESADAASQASAVLQTIAVIGELANGVPGDSCAATGVINAYTSGNQAQLGPAVNNFVRRIGGYIDTIVALVNNPNAARYSAGPKGNCWAGGRNYDFEGAWNAIFDSAGPVRSGLLNEEYCASKRLNDASDIRSNNLAAAITASTIEPVNRVAQRALQPLSQLLRVVAAGGNPASAAAVAKASLGA